MKHDTKADGATTPPVPPQHTQGEMRVDGLDVGRPYLTSEYQVGSTFGTICDFYCRNDTETGFFVFPNAEANAHRLALAWNCHDDLVAALERLAPFLSTTSDLLDEAATNDGVVGEYSLASKQARAALLKAKAGGAS